MSEEIKNTGTSICPDDDGSGFRNLAPRLAERMRRNWVDSPFFHLALWLSIPVIAAYLFGEQSGSFYLRADLLGFALVISFALVVIVNLNWDALRVSVLRIAPPSQWNLPLGWLMVGVAIGLRFALLTHLPPPFAGFEEYQMGGQAMRAKQGMELPFIHTSAVVMGRIGFTLSDNSIDSLRMVFRLAGGLSILVMAMALRRLSLGWTATLIAVFTMASLPLLVIAGGVADELFSDILFEMLLLYCVLSNIKSRELSLMWAGLGGVFAGILAYGYDSYLFLPALPVLYWFLVGLFAKGEKRRLMLCSATVYVLALTLVALPSIHGNLFGDFTWWEDRTLRHWDGREQDFGSYLYFKSALENVLIYASALSGQSHIDGIRLHGEPSVPTVVGIMFALGFIYALWRPGNQFIRIIALAVPVIIVFLSLFTRSHHIGRLAPAAPILIMLSGIALDAAIRHFRQADSPLLSRKKMVWLGTPLLLAAVVVAGNVSGVLRLASAESVLAEYSNNSYPFCRAIGSEPLELRTSLCVRQWTLRLGQRWSLDAA